MKKFAILVLSLALFISLCACSPDSGTDMERDLSNDEQEVYIDPDKYIIQTVNYQIYEEDLQKYRYRITSGSDVLVEDVKTGTEPRIEDKGNGIIRLHLGFGTNAFSVKYFDVRNKTVSKQFSPYTIFADYVDTKTKEYYIAYFKHAEQPKLYIDGFFDSSDFSTTLDLDFSKPDCEKLIFLNETEIYIEYVDTHLGSVKKVIDFKN